MNAFKCRLVIMTYAPRNISDAAQRSGRALRDEVTFPLPPPVCHVVIFKRRGAEDVDQNMADLITVIIIRNNL